MELSKVKLIVMDLNGDLTNSQASDITNYMYDFLNYLGINGSIVVILIIITIAFILKGILPFSAYLNGQLLRELKNKLSLNYSVMEFDYYAGKGSGYFFSIINEQTTRALQSFKSFI